MTVRTLIVGGVTVPLHAGYEITQNYEPLQARTVLRYASGTAVLRETWTGKIATEIRGRGAVPAGLQSVDYSAAVEIACVGHRAVTSTSNVITLPAARRTDTGSTPYARAWVGDDWQTTNVTVVTNTATCDVVASATAYQVVYFPKISCFAQPPQEDYTQNTGFGWVLRAEEV